MEGDLDGPGTATRGGILVSDFDGTMTRHDFYRLALERLLPADLPDYWARYRSGEWTHFETLATFFAAIRAPEAEVLSLMDDMELDPRLPADLDALDRSGWRVIVASAGCGWYIERLLRAAGCLDRLELHANPGQYDPAAGLVMKRPVTSRYHSPTVGIDKAAIVRTALATGQRVAFAGDGYPDIEAARLVPDGLRFAHRDLAEALRMEGLSYRPFGNWTEVVEAIVEAGNRVNFEPSAASQREQMDMKVAVFSARPYDQRFLDAANSGAGHQLEYFEEQLNPHTVPLAAGYDAVCLFVNDQADGPIVERLAAEGCKLIALRSAGFNHVDLKRAGELGLTVLRVPAYSPHAVAEHALALIMTLARRIHRAYNRAREGNFDLEGLIGRDINGSTVGIVGTGKIGRVLGQFLAGMGCRVLGYDLYPSAEFEALGGKYVRLEELLDASDIVSLHCPLTPETRYLINEQSLAQMKRGVMIVNTSRGGLVDTRAVIEALKSGQVGALALDVYEQEESLFFSDLSETIIQDDVFQRLLTFPNVLITGHQAFFTEGAMEEIAGTTIGNLTAFEQGGPLTNEVKAERK